MSEPVSRYDVSAMEKNCKKVAESLLYMFKLLEESGRGIEKQVKICVKDANNTSTKLVDKNNISTALNPKQLQQVEIAFNNPQKLKGAVAIFVGKEKILDVVNGQVYTDKLQLTKSVPTPLKQAVVEIRNQTTPNNQLVENVKELVTILRKRKGVKAGDYSPLSSNEYHFWEKDGEVAVSCKYGRGEILDSNGLTKVATARDKQNLEKIDSFISQLRDETARIKQIETVKQNTIEAPKVRM